MNISSIIFQTIINYCCLKPFLKARNKAIYLFKPFNILLAFIIISSILIISNNLNAEQIKKNMQCVCKLAKGSLCRTPVDDKTDSTETYWWAQTTIYEPGVTTQHDLNLACWENRNGERYGSGLCCSVRGDEGDADRFFKGKID